MSLARAALFARPRTTATLLLQRRLASSDSNSHHEHLEEHHEADNVQYPKEGFGGAAWRNTVLFALFVVGFYKFAPTPGEDSRVTRWIARWQTPSDVWANINSRHLYLSKEGSNLTLLLADARRPATHRYRYPQMFDNKSPHLAPLGGEVNLKGLKVKGDIDY